MCRFRASHGLVLSVHIPISFFQFLSVVLGGIFWLCGLVLLVGLSKLWALFWWLHFLARDWNLHIIVDHIVPGKLPGILTLRKVDHSVRSDSGPCPSLIEQEYRPKYFDEPDCLSSDKENMPPIESITPPSLKNLSLEEENIESNEHEATSWEANIAQNLDSLPRSSSPYPKKRTHTLEDLETDTDDNMVDMLDFFDRPRMKRGLQDLNRLKLSQNNAPHLRIVPHTHQRAQCQQHHLLSHIEMKFGGSSQTKEEYPMDGQLVSEGSHPG